MSLRHLAGDVRFTGRISRRNPAFAVTILAALAVALGGCAVIFSVADALLFRPVALPHAEQLVLVIAANLPKGVAHMSSSPAAFADYRRDARAFRSLAAYRRESLILLEGDQAERLSAARVSADFFQAAGAQPALGVVLPARDNRPEELHTAVLSHALWQRRFGGNAGVIGRAIHLDREVYTVVGVMPEGFDFPSGVDLWYPLGLTPEQWGDRLGHYVSILGRLAPGVSLERAQRDMDVVSHRLASQYPASDAGWSALVKSLAGEVTEPLRPALLVLFAAGALLLVVACGNFANLLLVRASARGREIACRAALGAGAGRLVRQLLTESVVLSLAGGLLGLALAPLATGALVRLNLDLAPRWNQIGVDWRAALFTLGLALVAGLLAGLAPVVHLRRADLRAQLSGSGPGTSVGWRRNRLTSLLAIVQIALSFVLLVGAALLVRSFYGLLHVDPGFDSRRVLTVTIELPRADKPPQRIAFFAAALARLRALPGVERAGATSGLPLGGASNLLAFKIPGRPASDRDVVPFYAVTPGYLETMRMPLRAGRYFAEKDRAGSPQAAVLSEAMARRYFPRENPVGRQILLGAPDSAASQIIGVVADVRDQALDLDGGPLIYGLHDQAPLGAMSLCLRTRTDPVSLIPAVRRALREIDPSQPLGTVATMDQLVLDSVADRRLALLVIGVFGAIALILAIIGVYGLLAYSVGRATREIGVRVALGAEPRSIQGLVWAYAVLVLVPGLLLGGAAAFAGTRLLAAQLFGVSRSDPPSYLGAAVLLAVMVLLACQAPARRAARVDPRVALSAE